MAEGNGGDISAVYALLQIFMEETRAGFRDLRAEIKDGFRQADAKIGGLRSEIDGLRTEMHDGFKRLDAEIAGLREAVTHYHSAVLGHGILISELDDRVRRIERHLDFPPIA